MAKNKTANHSAAHLNWINLQPMVGGLDFCDLTIFFRLFQFDEFFCNFCDLTNFFFRRLKLREKFVNYEQYISYEMFMKLYGASYLLFFQYITKFILLFFFSQNLLFIFWNICSTYYISLEFWWCLLGTLGLPKCSRNFALFL